MKANKKFNPDAIFHLSHKVEVIVPTTVNVNEVADTTEWVNRCATLLSECFGGATATKNVGYWVSETNGLVTESNTSVFAYATAEAVEQNMDKVYQFCLDMKRELKQEAVSLIYSNELYLI